MKCKLSISKNLFGSWYFNFLNDSNVWYRTTADGGIHMTHAVNDSDDIFKYFTPQESVNLRTCFRQYIEFDKVLREYIYEN